MTDYDALLTQIIAEPDADLPRLAFADMLEDYGRADRAELIRAQVGFADRSAGRLEVERRLLGSAGERVWQRRRGWALPAIVRPHWPREVGGWEWHRGFPEVWHCPLALWLAHGPAVAAATPI
ncbi:MAG TPA: TIGR02996 domain-containing protein, partial [Urbifossiella sp.]|nr:TIGR02996 domain-containing protein [Urbifossiella sp.]